MSPSQVLRCAKPPSSPDPPERLAAHVLTALLQRTGLDPALGDKIFLPFFTTKPEGSGIGLALARQVMLVHKGAITAGARPGGGAVFRLTF